MYLGVRNYHDVNAVNFYADAERALDRAGRTKTGRARELGTYGFPLGAYYKSVTWVRKLSSGGIAFRLYNTDVVVWFPDNSIEIENFGTKSTTQFASKFLPAGIHLTHEVQKRDGTYGYNGIQYTGPDGQTWVCEGNGVRLNPTDETLRYWQPEGNFEFTLPVRTDVSPRGLTKKYNLAEFERWLFTAPDHIDIEHEQPDLSVVLEALLAKDYERAAKHMPLVGEPKGFRAAPSHAFNIYTGSSSLMVRKSSLARVEVAIYYDEHAIVDQQFKEVPLDVYRRSMILARQLEGTGLSGKSYGI